MLRRHIQPNFGGCFLHSASRFCASAKILSSPNFFVNTTPSTSSLVRNFSSSTPILLQQQQNKFIKLPSVDDTLFTGEFRVIFKLAKFLSGLEEIPSDNEIPAGFASSELLALTEQLGQIVLTFANISLDDHNNNNNNTNGGLPKTFRFALALAVFIFDRAASTAGGALEFIGVDGTIKDAMPTKQLGRMLKEGIYNHMNPVLMRCESTLSSELQNQQHQIQDDEAKKFIELVLASTRMNVLSVLDQVKDRLRQAGVGVDVAPLVKEQPKYSSPVASGIQYFQDVIEIRDFDLTTGVTPIPGFREGLMPVLNPGTPYSSEKQLQDALLKWFTGTDSNPKIFGVAPNQFVVAVKKNFTEDDLHLDATVFLLQHQNAMGRLAILKLKVGEISPDPAEDDVSQLVDRLADLLDENPFRHFAFGIVTNGTSVQMFKVRAATPGSHRQVFERVVNACDPKNDKANREKLLDCLEFLLTCTPKQLGFVPHPTFNVDSKTGEVTMVKMVEW